MIALTKILIATLISFFCTVNGLNLNLNQKKEKNVNSSIHSETYQKTTCPKIINNRIV